MIPSVKQNLINLVNSTKNDRVLTPLNWDLFTDEREGIWLTVKNYRAKKGVATAMHATKTK